MAPRATFPSLILVAILVLVTLPNAVARSGIPKRHQNNSIRGDPRTEPINDPDCWCTSDTCFRCGIHLLNQECIQIEANGYCDEVVLTVVSVHGQANSPDVSDPLPPPIVDGEDMVACSQDVRECTDGSFVSRDAKIGCEYEPCPKGYSLVSR